MGSRTGEAVPPFLRKVYHMVDDSACDDIVSWTERGTQFTIHQTNEFASELLPKYFKHRNFSSFVRQLNSYGFRKANNRFWAFANAHFRKDCEPHLVNIKRRQGAKAKADPGPSTGGGTFESDQSLLERQAEDRQTAFENRVLHQEFQISKLEIAQLMHRLTKVEHVQEELLRILMQPTALMVATDGSAMGSTRYDTSPTVVKSVLESLYKQVREGRGHHHAADLVAATRSGVAAARGLARGSGLAAGRFGVYDPAQIETIYGNLASRGVADDNAAGGQNAGYR